jgi:hypothetical protein
MRLLCLFDAAKGLTRRHVRFSGSHAAALKILFEQSEMRSYFTCEISFCAIVSQNGKELCKHSSPTPHGYGSSVGSFSTSADIFRRRCASSLSTLH